MVEETQTEVTYAEQEVAEELQASDGEGENGGSTEDNNNDDNNESDDNDPASGARETEPPSEEANDEDGEESHAKEGVRLLPSPVKDETVENGAADSGLEEKEDDPMEGEQVEPNSPTIKVSVDMDNVKEDADNDLDDHAGPTLQFTFQQNPEDIQDAETENEKPNISTLQMSGKKRPRKEKTEADQREAYQLLNTHVEYEDTDPQTIADKKTVADNKPESELELALSRLLTGKENHVAKLTNEIKKLKGFISKRKQTYKRKRKDEGAPTRALSAYNIFVQDQFAKLAKKNSAALQSTDTNAQLERVPPANLVASTGGVWKNLADSEKEKYRERAKSDRKRYDEQMAKYQPPDKGGNRKRNKTGYNMFFSAHVLRLKQSEMGVPSERGSVARLVGTAWKQLSAEEKKYYEQEADKHNGVNPIEKSRAPHNSHHLGDPDDDPVEHDKDHDKEASSPTRQSQQPQAPQQAAPSQDPYATHGAYPELPPPYAISAQQHQQHAAAQAAAHHYYGYGHPSHAAYHYDYGGHAAASAAAAARSGRSGGYPYSHAPQHGAAHGYYDK